MLLIKFIAKEKKKKRLTSLYHEFTMVEIRVCILKVVAYVCWWQLSGTHKHPFIRQHSFHMHIWYITLNFKNRVIDWILNIKG